MEKVKRRVAIDMVLNEKVKELTAEAMSCLIKIMGMKSEIEAIEERIKTNTPFTDDDRKLISILDKQLNTTSSNIPMSASLPSLPLVNQSSGVNSNLNLNLNSGTNQNSNASIK